MCCNEYGSDFGEDELAAICISSYVPLFIPTDSCVCHNISMCHTNTENMKVLTTLEVDSSKRGCMHSESIHVQSFLDRKSYL